MKSKKGISLFELVIVMSIIIIILLFGWPVFTKLYSHLRIQSTVFLLANHLKSVRLLSVSRGVRAYLDFDVGILIPSDRFYIMYLDLNNNGMFDEGEDIATGISMPDVLKGYRGISFPKEIYLGTDSKGPQKKVDGVTDIPSDGISFSGNTNRASFKPIGTASAGGIYIYSKGEYYGITISSNTGRIKIWHWDGVHWRD